MRRRVVYSVVEATDGRYEFSKVIAVGGRSDWCQMDTDL